MGTPKESYTDVSEKSEKLLQDLCEHVKGGTAKLFERDGQIQVEYSDSVNQKVDVSQCCKIVAPKTNPKEAIESCLALIDFIKKERSPSGVLLDRTKISRNYNSTYEEGKDYDVLEKILGKGLNGKIVAVRDKKLQNQHAIKTMMLAYFNGNEIRCWADLEGCNSFPYLYMFKIEKGKIEIHYEILDKAVTISNIIDNHMFKIRENQVMLRYFSLYVLQGLLEASSFMHSKGWLHDDLHEDNAMLQAKPNAELKVRVLDFGRAKKLNEEKVIVKDIHEIIRMFTSVYVTEKFQNVTDLESNWKKKLQERAEIHQLSEENQEELLALVKLSLDVQLTKEEIELKKLVDCKLKDSLVESPDILQEMYKLIYPDNSLETDSVDGDPTFPYMDVLKVG